MSEDKKQVETPDASCHLQDIGMGSLICRAARLTSEPLTNEVSKALCTACPFGKIYRGVGCDAGLPKIRIYQTMEGPSFSIESTFCKVRRSETNLGYYRDHGNDEKYAKENLGPRPVRGVRFRSRRSEKTVSMAKLSKVQRSIFIAALFLVTVVWLCPPYKQLEVNEKGRTNGWHLTRRFTSPIRTPLDRGSTETFIRLLSGGKKQDKGENYYGLL